MHEEQRLGNFPSCTGHNARLPFGAPAASASTQGLHLCTDGDVLLGQADNGARAYHIMLQISMGSCSRLADRRTPDHPGRVELCKLWHPGACWLHAWRGQNKAQHCMLT